MDTLLAAEVIAKRIAEATVLKPIATELQKLAVAVKLTYGDSTSNSALRFDLDGETALGRLTWWTDGSLFVEALRISDGGTLVSQHAAGATPAEAAHALQALAGVVAGLPSNNSFKPNPLRGSA